MTVIENITQRLRVVSRILDKLPDIAGQKASSAVFNLS
jgi:hypothetical protein